MLSHFPSSVISQHCDREDPAFRRMEALCQDSTYTEFFWFPNNGVEAGYWENCWKDDGVEEEAIDINEAVADDYQVSTAYDDLYILPM